MTFRPSSHGLLDLYGCDSSLLRDEACLKTLLEHAARAAQATILESRFHTFGGEGGVTGILLLAESHISIHTWPEHGYAAVDLFFCAPTVDVERAVQVLNDSLQSQEHQSMEVRRGTHAVEPRSKSPVPKAG